TTTIREFIISLTKMGIPYIASFTFGLAAQLIFSLSDEFEKIKNAQIARGLEVDRGNLFKRIKNYIPILIPFTVRSIELADEINLAINLKNFDPSIKRFYGDRGMNSTDYLLISLSLIFLSLSLIIRFGGLYDLSRIYF
ncbi:MAG TPA: energy-coupling factor transporter transmembrane protein EcfT, partial [Thermoprotei archaeon]|nr:energy-coupling factor transporter transmembrane protein EcfT [Thermoprotei archaeon]